MILFKDRRIIMMIAIVIGTYPLNGNMSRRGKPSEVQTPNFISKRVTMLSEAMRAFLDAEAFLRAVFNPVSRSIAVALASAIEHAFPCLMWDAHRRAMAMLVIFEREAISNTSTIQFGSNQSRICSDIGNGTISEDPKVGNHSADIVGSLNTN